jgi:hypothetical protein
MIVYGDPQYRISASEAAERMREYVQRAQDGKLDSARDLLIAAGQLEQAIADVSLNVELAQEATDCAAGRFISIYRSERSNPVLLQRCHSALEKVLSIGRELAIKIPEGFAFYSLYPEQYCDATLEWLRGKRFSGPETILVVGIRSIGTTLSAVVKATLAVKGCNGRRFTVRPSGHPFRRFVELPKETFLPTAIVADEGPGLSGSSMAATAIALRQAGVRDVTFFPGHSNPPGSAASVEVRAIWSETPKIVAPSIERGWIQPCRELREGSFLGAGSKDKTLEIVTCKRSVILKETTERILDAALLEPSISAPGNGEDFLKFQTRLRLRCWSERNIYSAARMGAPCFGNLRGLARAVISTA